MTGEPRSPLSASRSPASLGFRMPPEWAPHRGTWLSWPHKKESWPGKFEPVPLVFADIRPSFKTVELYHSQ